MLRIPHCLDSRLTDGGKVEIPKCRQRSSTQKQYFSASGTHFCYWLSKPQGLVRLEGLGKLKKKSLTSSGLEPSRAVTKIRNSKIQPNDYRMKAVHKETLQ
jgi:hypothetical protein